MGKIDGVIFDWAGTTIDYGCFAPVKAFFQAFKVCGIEPAAAEIRKPMGMLKIDHLRAMLEMERIRELWTAIHGRRWNQEDLQHLYHLFEDNLMSALAEYTKPNPQVIETIALLRRQGIKIGSTTGYNDKMMAIVAPAAERNGYAPDLYVTPDAVGQKGRPYPYMIFKNMETLGLSDVKKVIKVGDTIADIQEGIRAGVVTIGIIEGSSELGMTEKEYAVHPDREECRALVRKRFLDAGADFVINRMDELPEYC